MEALLLKYGMDVQGEDREAVLAHLRESSATLDAVEIVDRQAFQIINHLITERRLPYSPGFNQPFESAEQFYDRPAHATLQMARYLELLNKEHYRFPEKRVLHTHNGRFMAGAVPFQIEELAKAEIKFRAAA